MTAAAARAALAALAADPAPIAPVMPTTADPRAAAVLMLFGELDHVPSTRPARAEAVHRDLDVLLLARASTLRSHPGEVAFPGGRLDPGDADAPAAALREAREETGLDPAGVEVLGTLPAVPLAHSNHLVRPVLGWWRAPSPVRVVDERESAAVFRTPVADLLDPAVRGVTVLRRDGREWRGPAFAVHSEQGVHTLWGFTAMLLDGLFDRLGWTEPWDRSRELPLPTER
ncbi:coenzyme A pyrophosphatase [Curtobacterium citreum]|nr:ADP-ribose pyrophosphatase YjhB (NUDIX family) [Curtobacterium sp. AG1037]TQJ26312.1 ADP-ribose pyrophosphatase YjhB (NUDIX family) [Curtobacterium citreum]GGL79363.1 coenzyme A pyrophosphatase [Curtobacterium citreum]